MNGNGRDDARMLAPFFLMDASYQIYCKDIKDMPCQHKVKAAKTKWKESYRKFYADFFRPLNEEQIDHVVDQMDELEKYIHNEVVMLKSSVMGVFPPEATLEEKKTLASVLACNVLAQIAQHIYEDMYRDKWNRMKPNDDIARVTRGSYQFAYYFPVSKSGIDITSSGEVSKAINVLCKEVIKFLKLKHHATTSKTNS